MNAARMHAPSPAGTFHPAGPRLVATAWAALSRRFSGLGHRQGRPTVVSRRSASQDAQAVREMAMEFRQSDPGFAADLFAAADRHELLHG